MTNPWKSTTKLTEEEKQIINKALNELLTKQKSRMSDDELLDAKKTIAKCVVDTHNNIGDIMLDNIHNIDVVRELLITYIKAISVPFLRTAKMLGMNANDVNEYVNEAWDKLTSFTD